MKSLGISNKISFEYGGEKWFVGHVIGGCVFFVENDNVKVIFEAEGRNGATYSKVKSYWNKVTDRCYTAQRFTIKYECLASEAAYILAKNDYLWDYEAQCPLIKTRQKALQPYYDRCKELGLEV